MILTSFRRHGRWVRACACRAMLGIVLFALSLGTPLLHLPESFLAFVVPEAEAAPGIYKAIPYQGKMALNAGSAVGNGQYNMRFKIFTQADGGSPQWTETWDDMTQRVTMTGGLFTVYLGTHEAMTDVDFNSDTLYLQVEFDPGNDGTYEEVFSPRRRFASVPYALNADMVDGLHGSQLVRNDTHNVLSGSLLIHQEGVSVSAAELGIALEILGTASGRILHAQDSLTSSGTLVWEGSASGASLWVSSLTVGNVVQGAGLTDCDLSTQKLLWDATTGQFSCGTDNNEGGGGSFTSTGALQVAFDQRYVQIQGDTMTGGLLIMSGGDGTQTIDAGLLLEVAGTASGRIVHAQDSLTSSGTLVWEGNASGATLWVSSLTVGNAVQGAGLTDCDLSTQKLLWDDSTGRFSCGADSSASYSAGQGLTLSDSVFSLSSSFSGTALEIIGTASGRILHAQDRLESSGSLLVAGDISTRGNMILNSDQGNEDTIITFGNDEGAETIRFSNTTTKFAISDTVEVTGNVRATGNLSGSTLNIDESVTLRGQTMYFPTNTGVNGNVLRTDGAGNLSWGSAGSGTTYTAGQGLMLNGTVFALNSAFSGTALEIMGTASGRIVHAQDSLTSSGTLVWEGNASGASLWVSSLTVGNSFFGAGLTDCDLSTQKLLWDDTTGKFSCGMDTTVEGALFTSTGALQVTFDQRYVQIQGDTMTGGLLIMSGGDGTQTIDAGLLLEVAGTASGRIVHAQDSLTSSGTLIVHSSTVAGLGVMAAIGAPYQTGAYLFASGASVLALDSYGSTQTGVNAHILFGSNGVFDTALYRSGTNGSGGLILQSQAKSAEDSVWKVISRAGGSDNTVFRVQADGEVRADGSFVGGGADYAEYFYTSTPDVQFGELVCIDIEKPNTVRRCEHEADGNLMGIVSSPEQAAFIGNRFSGAEGLPIPGTVLVGLLGQLQTRVLVASGAEIIRPGDALTSSAIPGIARRARAGEPTVGVALEGFEEGSGSIAVLVARSNSSLTVDAVSDKVFETVAAMQIGDEIDRMMSDALQRFNVEEVVAQELRTQLSSTGFRSAIGLMIADRVREQSLLTFSGGLSLMDPIATSSDVIAGGVISSSALTVYSVTTLRGRTEIVGDLLINGVPYRASDPMVPSINPNAHIDFSSIAVRDALLVLGDITIQGLAEFLGDVHIGGTLALSGTLVVNRNQAGFALIPKTGTSVLVAFEPAFTEVPVVTATSNAFDPFRIRSQSATGFTIDLRDPAPETTIFSWHALTVHAPRTVVASGTVVHRIDFPVDERGVPLSGNPVWNACIRNQVLLDSDGQPYSCGRYHVDYMWTHPDLLMEFTWRDDIEPHLVLSEEFVPVVVLQQEALQEEITAEVTDESIPEGVASEEEIPSHEDPLDHAAAPEQLPVEVSDDPIPSVDASSPLTDEGGGPVEEEAVSDMEEEPDVPVVEDGHPEAP